MVRMACRSSAAVAPHATARRFGRGLAIALSSGVLAAAGSDAAGAGERRGSERDWKGSRDWVATWATAPHVLGPLGAPGARGLENETVRLGDDVFARAGVREVILLEGINDITHPDTPEPRHPCLTRIPISAEGLAEHYEQLIDRAHARGLRIYGGTLTPSMGWPGFDEAAEAKRQQVNRWIRTSGAFDRVIDFDAALRDPQDPTRLAPQYDSGDHLHPNDAGHQRMGDLAYRVVRRAGKHGRNRLR